jgi:hypothetical protein
VCKSQRGAIANKYQLSAAQLLLHCTLFTLIHYQYSYLEIQQSKKRNTFKASSCFSQFLPKKPIKIILFWIFVLLTLIHFGSYAKLGVCHPNILFYMKQFALDFFYHNHQVSESILVKKA